MPIDWINQKKLWRYPMRYKSVWAVTALGLLTFGGCGSDDGTTSSSHRYRDQKFSSTK